MPPGFNFLSRKAAERMICGQYFNCLRNSLAILKEVLAGEGDATDTNIEEMQ